MSTFLTYTVAFWIGFIISYILFRQSRRLERSTEINRERVKTPKSLEQERQVLGLFETRTEIRNDDVQDLLSVSDATATRVLDRLEANGAIAVHGKTKDTFYTLK